MQKQDKHKSALKEKKGVSQQEVTNTIFISKLKGKRKIQLDTQDLINEILKRDITALSRAITLIESKNIKHL